LSIQYLVVSCYQRQVSVFCLCNEQAVKRIPVLAVEMQVGNSAGICMSDINVMEILSIECWPEMFRKRQEIVGKINLP